MKKILEIRLHGRGGQGTVTAAEIIAVAAFYDGKWAQAFPYFGVERRGAPVSAFCRIAAEPIRLREQIYFPEYVIVQDAGLVKSDESIFVGIEKSFGVLINSEKEKWPEIKNKNVVCCAATKIALEKIGKPFFNTALVGAFSAMSGAISLDSLRRAIEERFSGSNGIAKSNVEAMEEAFNQVKNKRAD